MRPAAFSADEIDRAVREVWPDGGARRFGSAGSAREAVRLWFHSQWIDDVYVGEDPHPNDDVYVGDEGRDADGDGERPKDEL